MDILRIVGTVLGTVLKWALWLLVAVWFGATLVFHWQLQHWFAIGVLLGVFVVTMVIFYVVHWCWERR